MNQYPEEYGAYNQGVRGIPMAMGFHPGPYDQANGVMINLDPF